MKAAVTVIFLSSILIFTVYNYYYKILVRERKKGIFSRLPNKEEMKFDPVMVNFNRLAAAENQERVINCSNIHTIKIKTLLANGRSKHVVLGDFNGGSVVVKMTTNKQTEIRECLAKVAGRSGDLILEKRCNGFPRMKMMKEILLHHELMHPNMAYLLGFCVRSEELDSTDLIKPGVISVFEYGESVSKGNLTSRTWPERYRYAVGLAAFVRYLKNSPIGSIRYEDLTLSHMTLMGRDIKITDISSFENLEPLCNELDKCKYGLDCIEGECKGHNAKYNLETFYRQFFRDILMQGEIPSSLIGELQKLQGEIKPLTISVDELVERLLQMR